MRRQEPVKTLAWLAPVVSEGLQTVAVYPTNALIEDQVRNIDEKLEDVEGEIMSVSLL